MKIFKNKKLLAIIAVVLVAVIVTISLFVYFIKNEHKTVNYSVKDTKYCSFVRKAKKISNFVYCSEYYLNGNTSDSQVTVVFDYNYHKNSQILNKYLYTVDKSTLEIIDEATTD